MENYPMFLTWLPIIFLWFIVFWQMKKRKNAVKSIIKHKKEGINEMEETIRSFMNMPVYITLISEETVDCVIKSYNDGWITVLKKEDNQAINCDYIVKIIPKKVKQK